MDNATLIDRERLKELLRDGYDMGLIQGIDDIEGFIDKCPAAPQWIKTAERKPTAADADENGDVLSININPGDLNTTNWPWSVVAVFPENLPVWMPLPKKPEDLPIWQPLIKRLDLGILEE